MKIDFPDHPTGEWKRRPWWLFWKPMYRRRHWRWTVDHQGCECTAYWQYAWWGGDSSAGLKE
jgi:hypothetical protein